MTSEYRYPWPASRLDPALMNHLYRMRESAQPRVPISELVRRAVAHACMKPEPIEEQPIRKIEEDECED
jgi:hypothetical protein